MLVCAIIYLCLIKTGIVFGICLGFLEHMMSATQLRGTKFSEISTIFSLYLDQNCFISWFTNPHTVIFQIVEKNSSKVIFFFILSTD